MRVAGSGSRRLWRSGGVPFLRIPGQLCLYLYGLFLHSLHPYPALRLQQCFAGAGLLGVAAVYGFGGGVLGVAGHLQESQEAVFSEEEVVLVGEQEGGEEGDGEGDAFSCEDAVAGGEEGGVDGEEDYHQEGLEDMEGQIAALGVAVELVAAVEGDVCFEVAFHCVVAHTYTIIAYQGYRIIRSLMDMEGGWGKGGGEVRGLVRLGWMLAYDGCWDDAAGEAEIQYLLIVIYLMSKAESDTHLRFGHGILIEGFKTDGVDVGLLTAQGFADIKVKYQTYDDILFFKNYRNSIFQILPAGNFQLNDELQKALIQNEGKPDTPNITILRARAESERMQFELNCNNNMQKNICFGHSVIFKHIDSQSYVSGTIRPSTGSNGAFTVQVSEKLSDSLVFKLMPYRSFESVDMPIPFDSPILIKNEYNNGYMTFEKIGMADSGAGRGTYIEKKPIESNDSYSIPVKTQSAKSDVYEVVTHFVDLSCEKEVPMPWRFALHVREVVNDTLIQHDVVFLQHTLNQGVLSSYGKNIILKELKDNNTSELRFYDCLWQIEKHNHPEKSDAYILRHLMSGMVLGQIQQQDGRRRAVLYDISAGKPEQGEIPFVQVRLAKKEGGDINSESYVNIAWGEELLEILDDENGLQQSVRKEGQAGGRVDLVALRQEYKKEIEYNIKPLVFRKSVKQEHCFVIMQIEDELKRDLLFALSFHSVIIRLREDLKFGAIEAAKKISYLRMMQVTGKIREIKRFVKNCGQKETELQHIFPIEKRQMICKDLGISELLFELLYFMKMNLREDIFSDKHNEKEKFLQLYNTLYDVNRELIRKNYLFKMHISKWFEFILQDVIAGDVDVQLSLLKELLQDNQFFTGKFVTEEIVAYLTSSFGANPDNKDFTEKKYLEIFRLFCISSRSVNTHNQKIVLDHFIKPIQSQHSIFAVNLQRQDGRIVVIASLDKTSQTTLPFAEFHDLACQNHPSAWSYFVEYLNLIADLTQGRNKITELELVHTYTLELLGDLFQNETLYEAEVPVIRLLHYLYAESEYYYPIERRRRLFNYHTLVAGEEVAINCTTAELKPWEPPLDRILARLLTRVKDFGPIRSGAESEDSEAVYKQNQVLLTLLKFMWESINLGFWQNKASVKEILTDVLHICSKPEDVGYEGVEVESKENLLMISCKTECLNIIDLIADLDNDVHVQNIAARFKQVTFKPKKFNLKGMISSTPILQIKCDNQLVDGFLKLLPEDDSLQPILETAVVHQMIEISNYHNARLTSSAISVIERVLQTRRKAFKQFSELIVISQQERQKLVDFMEFHRSKFFILDDPGIVGVNEDNQTCNYFMVYDRQNLGLMEVLHLLTELMKNENSVLQLDRIRGLHDSGIFQALGSGRLINFTGERSSTSRMKQEIVFSSNLHTKVLGFIFNCKQVPETELGRKLLHMSYYFVVALIENFNQIKAMMQWHIPRMIHHIKHNVGCIDFLKEMYDNNKTMLYNEMTVFELIKEICENIEGEHDDSYYKSKLLDFFRYLIYCNGRTLKSHQIQILKIMQDDSYHNIMVKTDLDIAALVQQYELDNQGSAEVEMSAELTYITTFFQLMASLIDCTNGVNIGKLVKRYPFDTLVSYIQAAGSCWPLKRNLRALINRLYYFADGLETLLKPILSRQLPNMVSDFNFYIGGKNRGDVSELQNKKFKNPVRFSYLQSYHYLLIEQSLFTIINLISKEKVVNEMVNYLNNYAGSDLQASYSWFKITERLAWLQQFFTTNKNVYSNSMIKFILSRVKPMLQRLDEATIFQVRLPDARKQAMIERLCEGRITKFFEESSALVTESEPLSFHVGDKVVEKKGVEKVRDDNRLKDALRVIFRNQKKDFQNQDERINYNLQQLISSVKLSAQAQNYMDREYLDKVGSYYDDEKVKYEYVKRIIALNSRDPTALTPERKYFFLLYITGLIEHANKSLPAVQAQEGAQPQPKKEIDEWSAQDWKASEADVKVAQQQLKHCELGKFIVDLLKEDVINNIELANSILLCAIAYMLGGNPNTQKNVLEALELDADNQVFANIEALIIKLGKLIRKSIDENNMSKMAELPGNAEFAVDMVDNYDFFDDKQKYTMRKNVSEPNSTDEFLYGKLCITTYRRAFKFLQILCESNNKEGKHFIRAQPGKSPQFNFIEITTKELRNLFQIYCYEIQIVPAFLLDFLLEVTQIPIYDNQAALMSSTFFEDLCQLKNSFSFTKDKAGEELKQKRLADRNFKDLDAVNQIFYKSFKIILSNFEGNDPRTFAILDNKLESKFLMLILQEKLSSMAPVVVKEKVEAENGEEEKVGDGRVAITNYTQLTGYISAYSNQVDEQGNKKTDFNQDILIVLDIITIYLKMRDARGGSSRIYNYYEKFKKDQKQRQREIIKNLITEEVPQSTENRDTEIETKTEEAMGNYKCMYGHLQKLLLSIEVTDEKRTQQTIYFPRYPVFQSLSGNLRDYVMLSVSRDSHRDKIISLLSYTDGIKEKIEYSYNLKKKKGITESNMTDSFRVAAILSVIICIYITVFYQVNIEYQNAEYYSKFTVATGRFILSFIQLVFSVLYFFYWFQLKLWFNPQEIDRKPEEASEEAPAEGGQAPAEGGQAPVEGGQVAVEGGAAQAGAEGGDAAAEVQADRPPPGPPSLKDKAIGLFNKGVQKGKQWLQVVADLWLSEDQVIYKSPQFWRNVVFLGASVIGTFYFPPMFFLHLMLIFSQVQKLGTILLSAVYNLKSLVYISIMGVVFTIVFCTVTFSNYMKNVYTGGEDASEMCDGVMNCVSQLYVSGAIGQTMQEFQIMRFIYDVIYITFFDTMFSNIVSGLMLDAFSSLRQEADARASDKENTCYVCNISRQSLEKQGEQFFAHTRKKHFLWNYIFYIYVLERKDQNDYTGLEYYIRLQYFKSNDSMDVDWIPSKGESEFDVQAEASSLSQNISQTLKVCKETQTSLENAVSAFKNLAKPYLQ